ncbi:MAG: hypothetical protein PHP61_00970 [Candidatus Izemoplasmatales bacterium]|nr:hypothetical protein [Candidatus Izemoplasmatales bacterium]MDD4988068.1 hypothetical protein [Candidatus Izemoplasmatales bacterium]
MKIEIFTDNLKRSDCQHNPVYTSSWLICSHHSKICVIRSDDTAHWRFPAMSNEVGFLKGLGLIPDAFLFEKSVEVTLYRLEKTEIRSYYQGDLSALLPDKITEKTDLKIEWLDIVDLLNQLDEPPLTKDEDYESREADFVALINSI